MTEIENAVEGLYTTFARYPRPSRIEYCPCGCTKPGATAPLVAVSLRELLYTDLVDYSFSAMTTQGTVNDFRYLLPRLFRAIVEADVGIDAEILIGKLSYARWMTWPKDEVAAVRTYLHALWHEALISFPLEKRLPAFFGIETVLASIAQTGESLEPHLQFWTENRSREADEHLIQLVTMCGGDFFDGRTLDRAFWEHSKLQAAELRRWLLQPDTLHRIADSAHLLRNDGYEHLFQPAFEVLQNQGRLMREQHP